MKKIYLILIAFVVAIGATAQKANVDIKIAPAPTIDGYEDDAAWALFEATPLEKNYGEEQPSITAAWFKAYYDEDNIYVFFSVEDDEHLPAWTQGVDAHWEWDKPEIYFDVNAVLADEVGAKNAGDGHWQYAPPFEEDKYDTPYIGGDIGETVTWCYTLVGEGYTVEYQFPLSSLTNADGEVLTAADFEALPEKMGFDLTAIDRDSGDDARKRLVWQCNVNEAWANMDDAGTLTFTGERVGFNEIKAASLNVFPNPVQDVLTIDNSFNKVVITNIIGQEVKVLETSSKTINVSDLTKGVYVVSTFENGVRNGYARITKN